MATPGIENGRITRREFLVRTLEGFVVAFHVNRYAGWLIHRLGQIGIDQKYPDETVNYFGSERDKVTKWFADSAQKLNIKPPVASGEIFHHPPEGKTDSIIDSISPNPFMVFVPGATSEEMGNWVGDYLHPWMTAFNSLRTGRSKDEVDPETAAMIKSLEIDHLMGAPSLTRRVKNMTTMIPQNIHIFPWEFTTGGRGKNGTVPPEHPEAMAVFLAGYMKWIISQNPSAEFILMGHSLGASAVHCLLRLIQGGIYQDLASHIPHTILYSQAYNDLNNALAYNIRQNPLKLADLLKTPSNVNTDQGLNSIRNQISVVLNGACIPDYFSGLNPQLLKKRHGLNITSVYSPDDPVSCGVPGANGILLQFDHSRTKVKSVLKRIVPEPTELISIPNDLFHIFDTLTGYTHFPNPAAIKPIFGI